MTASYSAISEEIGYEGYMTFPEKGEIDNLLDRLSYNPTIEDFRKALRLYRFLPEAKTVEQQRTIYKLQLGLSISREKLFSPVERQPLVEWAVNYIMNLIPALALFLVVI